MTEEAAEEISSAKQESRQETPKIVKFKRDILRFSGGTPNAINLDYVDRISLEEKRIFFFFNASASSADRSLAPPAGFVVDMEDEATALATFESILSIWAGGVP